MTYDITDAIDAVAPAVVQISVAAGGAAVGTGFLVNDSGHVITAHHVIRDLGGGATIGVAIPNYEDANKNRISGSFWLSRYDVVAIDEPHDLALLRPHETSGNPFQEPRPRFIRIGDAELGIEPGIARLRAERPRDGMAIATSGYPFGTVNMITSTGYVASSWAVELKQIDDPRTGATLLQDVADSYLADMQVNGGNSGGPVYRLADEGVIGVCVSTRGAAVFRSGGDPVETEVGRLYYNSGIASIVPAMYVAELLDRAGSAWTAA
jgi:S1-C subfamily serine protease